MQIAGQLCSFCFKKIVLCTEGCICSGCQLVAHHNCIKSSDGSCSKCGVPLKENRSYAAFASRCPVCGASNVKPPDPVCRYCNSLLGYESLEAFEAERQRIHKLGRKNLTSSFAMILMGALILTFAWIVISGILHPFGIILSTPVAALGTFLIYRALKLGSQSFNLLRFY